MRKSILIALILTLSIAFGCSAASTPKIDTEAQKVSYGIGLQVGRSLITQGLEGIDPDILLLGLTDALANKKELAVSEQDLRAAFASMKSKQDAKKAEMGQANLKKADAFMKENAKKKGVKTLESGVQYKVLKSGKGKTPKLTDDVEVHYKGTNMNGEEFDSSYKRGKPAQMSLSHLIKGFADGLAHMKEGDKWILYIPPSLGYGPASPGPGIGPNELLIFEVELISVK